MFKNWSKKLARSYVATVLAASLVLSVFPISMIPSPFLRSSSVIADSGASEDITVLEKVLTGSNGKDYHFTASYSSDSGLPKDAELSISEITEGPEYDQYIEDTKTVLESDTIGYAHLFDIKIVKDGEELQPNNGSSVNMQIELEDTKSEDLKVVHFPSEPGDGNAEVLENTTTSNEGDTTVVEFTAEGFSVYAIVDHEGGEVVTPRFTIHYLSPVTDTSTQESEVGGQYYYTVEPFEFPNTANQMQTTQIVQDGETLEMIANPPNQTSKFFYGWYVVDVTSQSGNSCTFRWPDAPKHLPFETPISVANNGDGTFTMTWTANGKTYSETADMDATDYSAHIYVAPIYEDYCFVNFHELAYAVSANSNLLTRKLIILGSDNVENVLISDVSAQATDTIRRIFRGWQYRANNTWVSVQTMDDNGNPITKYIEVTDHMDLYPYFQEGRWLYFNVGDSGNGAQYVPAQFTLAEFNSQEGGASVGGTVTSLPTTSRVGYDFAGWRVITGYSDANQENPIYQRVTDENGNFLSSVDLSINGTYLDNDGNPQTGVAYTIKNGELTIKYPLESLTFYAEWAEKANSSYTVVIWKQKVTDDPDADNAHKTYDYYALDSSVLPSVVSSASGLTVDQLNLNAYRSLTTNNGTKNDFTGFHLRTTDPVTMNSATVRGDGSSVVNIYYDRNVHTLTFQVQSGNRWNTIKTIRDLYEDNISSNFPIVGTNGVTYDQGERWQPQNSSTFSEVLVYIDIMPDEDVTFHLNTSANDQKHLYYYIEPLPDEAPSADDRTYNGKRFKLYHHTVARYGYFTEAEDYLSLIGFYTSDAYAPQAFNSNGNSVNPWGQGTGAVEIYCYYLRSERTFTFDYNYPVAAGMAAKSVVKEGVLYETSLEKFDYTAHPDDLENAVRPTGSEIPDHYEFGGWYEDAACTERFDFTTTMPDADKKVYGKWTPIYYTISIDPNGGVIDHINYSEPEDGEKPTFYLDGFTSANASDPKWIAAWNANGDTVGTMPSWATTLSAVGSGHNTAYSTYFSAMYGTAIGEYELERTYVEYNGADDGTKYYYVNMQFNDTSGGWGIHADMRNALYLTESQLLAYYKYCKATQAWHEAANPGYYDGTIPATFEEFKSMYVKKNGMGNYVLYQEVPSGSYAFVGWYKVNPNGTVSDSPYSFANAIEGEMTLRAVWRRVGSYYISYDPSYILTLDDGSEAVVNGEIVAWTDPANPNDEKYNDGAQTTTLQQPTGITVNGLDAGDEIIFRGWQVVDFQGYDANGHAIYTPRHNVYYAEPTEFIIDASDADDNGCIHMQAVYQTLSTSDRRPKVANLMLHANDGHLTNGNGSALTGDVDITSASGWTGTGAVVEDQSENEIVFGDMQSNNAVHVYKYAVTPGTLDAPYDASGNYFKHDMGYFLIGFDEGSDYSMTRTGATDDDLRTGDPFVPTFAADSVISVQRTDSTRLYAVWEPMVYVTFTNRTSSDVTFNISGTGDAMSVVNETTGVFGREKYTQTTVTLNPGKSIKFAIPYGAGEEFTINGTNINTAQLLNITSYFQGIQTAMATAGLYRSSGANYTLTDLLHVDPDGVHVYFDGVDAVFFDVNASTAVWTDTRTGSDYSTVASSSSLVYVDEDGLPYEPIDFSGGNSSAITEPSDPTRPDYLFIGWTADADAASCDPAAYTLPGTSQAEGINNMAVIKSSLLWDFTTEVDHGMTLYAIWGEEVKVTFHLYNNQQTWTDGDTTYYVPGSNYTHVVTMIKGDILRMPAQPTWTSQGNLFYRWVTVTSHQSTAKTIDQINNIYEYGTPVLQDMDLYSSWIKADHIDVTITKTVANGDGSPLTASQAAKDFTINAVITTTRYTGTVTRSSGWLGVNFTTSVSDPTSSDENQMFTLKDGESITIPLYYDASEQTGNISSNGTRSVSVFFQSIKITEVSDPDYTVTVSINGQTATMTDTASVSTYDGAKPTFNNPTGNNRNYTLSGRALYTSGTTVPVDYTNTRTNTDVTITKVVTPDDYTTGNEEFGFTVSVFNTNGYVVTPAEYDGKTLKLKNGESMTIKGVPIGGEIRVEEDAPGWTAVSVNDADSTDQGGKVFTLQNVPKEGGGITFTNTRDTYDVTVSNEVLSEEYGSKTKNFTYTATLWNGDTQVAFPSSITDVTFSDGRKTMTFDLKDDGSYVIKDLPGGYKLVVTQDEDEDYITTVGRRSAGVSYTITDLEEDVHIEFVNRLKTGEYTITKNVQLDEGQSIPAGTTFAFSAKLLRSPNSNTPVAISSDIASMATALGATVSGDVIYFSLADGGSITLTDLPVGYFLQVQETAPGFAAYVSNIRTDTVTVTIAARGNSDINFINRIASAILKVKKVDKEDGSPVAGATFRLYNIRNGSINTLFTLTSGADGYLAYTESGVTSTELTLESGTYFLAEQSPAAGYRLLNDTITITVDNNKPEDERITISNSTAASITGPVEGKFTVTVTNTRVLPAPTGIAMQTMPFVLVLFLGAALFLGTRKARKQEQEDDEKKDE